MKQFVAMNSETGEVCPVVKVTLTDNYEHEEELANLEGYSVQLRSNDFDGWLIYSGNEDTGPKSKDTNGPWLFIKKDVFDSKCEIICEF